MTIVYFLIVLGILIFVHEFGHFIAAKKLGVFVEEFALGFGPAIFKRKIGDTVYRLNMFPLGGYVKPRGEGEDQSDDPRSFAGQSLPRKALIVAAGPIMNIMLAFLLMPIVFMIGKQEPIYLQNETIIQQVQPGSPAALSGLVGGDKIISINGKTVDVWRDAIDQVRLAKKPLNIVVSRKGVLEDFGVPYEKGYVGFEPELFEGDPPIISGISVGGPAEKAGIMSGDYVKAINNEMVGSWVDMSDRINRNGDKEVVFLVERSGREVKIKIKPEFNKKYDRYLIGIRNDNLKGMPRTLVRYGFIDSIKQGSKECVRAVVLTLGVLKGLVTLNLSYKVLGGPVIIAKASAAAATAGLAPLIYFICFLSINLFVLNLLPIPVLDGGRLLFFGIEAIIRRPIPSKISNVANQLGFALLMLLMLAVTINDLDRIWNISRIWKNLF